MKSRLLGIIAFSVVLIASFTINGILSHSGFESVYTDALMSRYSISGEAVKNKIEASLNLGKKIYLLDSQIDYLFTNILAETTGIEHVYLADSRGTILNTTRTVLNQNKMPFTYYEGSSPSPKTNYYTFKFLNSWFLCIPLFTGDTFTGTLYMEVQQDTISEMTRGYVLILLKYALCIFAAAFVLYLLFCFAIGSSAKAEMILTVVLVLASQAGFSVFTETMYNKAITGIFNANMQVLAESVTGALESPARFTGGFENIEGIDNYLANRLAGNDNCAAIYMADEDLNVVYSAKETEGGLTINQTDSDFLITPLKNSGRQDFYLVLQINRAKINRILRDMTIDSAVVVLVALIFAFILKDVFALLANKKHLLVAPAQMNDEENATALRLIKISTFLFMFAAYETLSFLPMFIQSVYKNSRDTLLPFIAGMGEDTIISLPVSSYMLGITISMFVTLFAFKNITVKNRYVLMSIIFVAGTVLTIMSFNMQVLTLARLVAGFGFGGILLSTSSLVIEYTSEKTRSAGFGTNASALAAASIASIPVGGVIVNKFGYNAGLIISIVFAFVFLAFSVFCVPGKKKAAVQGSQPGEKISGNVTLKDFSRVLFSRHIFVYILCINIPFQLIYWGLFNFLLPLYMSDTLHLSSSNIGLILSIFSVVSLAAAAAGRMADRIKNDKLLIGFGAATAGISFLIFGSVAGGIALFVIVMLCMGVDNLFIDSIEEVYLEAGRIKGVEGENVLQSYKVIEKVLSVFVPAVTGIAITALGFNRSLFFIGGWSLAGGILFILLGKNCRWEKKQDEK